MNQKFEDYDFIDIKNKKEPESAMLAEAWAILLRYKTFFIICLLISLSLGYMYIRTTPKTYKRMATVMIKDERKGAGMVESQTFNDILSFGNNAVENQVGVIKSRRLMYKVAKRLKLDMSYRALNMKKSEMYVESPLSIHIENIDENATVSLNAMLTDMRTVELSGMKGNKEYTEKVICKIGKPTDTPIGRVTVTLNASADNSDIGQVVLVGKRPMKALANGFCNRLMVEVMGAQSSLVGLSIIDENPKRAEDVINTLIDVYNQDGIDDKNVVVVNTANFINERLRIIENELDHVDSEIELYKKNNRLTDLSSESDVFLKNSNDLGNEGLSLENQLNMTEYMKSYLSRNNKNTEMIPASIGIQDNGIQIQITGYNELVSKRNKLRANSSERNPLVVDMDATLLSQRKAIVRALDNLQTSLQLQVMNMKDKEQETFDKIANLPTQQKEIVGIERQQKIKEELYLYLLNKKEENELQKTIAESNCKVVDVADGPPSPVAPNKIQVILICLIAGISVPALWLYLRSLLNTKVYSKEDIKDKLSIPYLGELPFDKHLEEKDIMMSETTDHESLNEALRTVRENLNFMKFNQQTGGKVIQIISLNPSSGKTFISINLSASIALAKSKVIVLDLDLRKASLTRRLQISTKRKGISNYLANECDDWKDMIQTVSTQYGCFDVIPSGAIPPNPAELLKDIRLDEMIELLKKQYDYVLIDNPPYGIVVDAFVSSRLADLTIYVIRSGVFDKRLLPDLQELYDSKKIKNLSILLNGVNFEKMMYNYRYHYRYSYYHYGSSNKKESRWCRFFRKSKNRILGRR